MYDEVFSYQIDWQNILKHIVMKSNPYFKTQALKSVIWHARWRINIVIFTPPRISSRRVHSRWDLLIFAVWIDSLCTILSLANILFWLVCVGHVVAMCLIQDSPCFPWPIISDANGMKLTPQWRVLIHPTHPPNTHEQCGYCCQQRQHDQRD